MTSTTEREVTMPVEAHLYDISMRHTNIVDYGYSAADAANGVPIPPQGARIDMAVEGVISGPHINGRIKGVDYGELRADGRFQLNIHATITTDDGERIALYADGIFRFSDGAVRENVTLKTASPRYAWVNGLQIWATGIADVPNRRLELHGYIA